MSRQPQRLPDETLEQRLLRHCVKDKCWLWKGQNKYGSVRFAYQSISAHRAAYLTWVGPIPEGACVCHHCDNPGCINPQHLFIGTIRNNAKDKVRKGRHGNRWRNPVRAAQSA